ncbi:MAG: ADP-ribosylglycohydrolase family protein [Hormoscilla sp. GUM202]|nr:ADP-ribosylglycohydrolase family protein [Hormoscilla sp. GUM202]
MSTAEFFHIVLENVPECETYRGIEQAANIPFATDTEQVAMLLGSGMRVSAQDTVPFALWCAARHLQDYLAALWTTAIGLGDMNMNCAIVGGIVALSAGERAHCLDRSAGTFAR